MGGRLIFLIPFIVLLFSGCSSTPDVKVHEDDAPPNFTQQYLESREYAIESAQEALDKAGEEQLEYFSPRRVFLAQEKLFSAQEEEKDKDAIELADQVKVLLEIAQKNKTIALERLSQLFQQKNILEQLHADRVHRKTYQQLTQSLQNLIAQIEDKPGANISSDTRTLSQAMIELEIDTLLSSQLGEAEKFFARAKQEEASIYAPVTYQQAEKALSQARQTIQNSYRETQLIEQEAHKASRLAQRTLYLSREVQSLINLKASAAEQIALEIEKLLHNIGQHMKLEDLRAMSLQDQSLAIIQALENQEIRVRQELEKEYRDQRNKDQQRIKQLEQQLEQQLEDSSPSN